MPRAVRFHQTGGPEVLQIETIDVPPPGAGRSLMRIASWSRTSRSEKLWSPCDRNQRLSFKFPFQGSPRVWDEAMPLVLIHKVESIDGAV